MINFNGEILNDNSQISINNRGYNYGDAVFETIKVVNGNILFLEDHYFRLMASMRILRMEIPMYFTMEFFKSEIDKLLQVLDFSNSARIKFTVHRKPGGLYLPKTNDVGFLISAKTLETQEYILDTKTYKLDLYKDYYVSPSLLSTLKTNNKVLHVVGSIYADENKLDNCFIINTNKSVIEALNGNIFLVKDNIVKTPPISDGCLKGIIRKQIIDILSSSDKYELIEMSISPFELQKADEIFITNVVVGIKPVTNYRRKAYAYNVAKELIESLNEKAKASYS